MTQRITERDLAAQASIIARMLDDGRPLQVHTESGLWILDVMEGPNEPESWRIHHRLHVGTTKRDLYDFCFAFRAGLEYRDYYQRTEAAR